MMQQAVLDPALESALTAEIDAEIRAAFEFARSAAFPDPGTAGSLVYA